MTLDEIKKQERELEFEREGIQSKLKELKGKHHREVVKETVETLMGLQAKEGSLDRFALQVYLDDLATKIRNMYDK